MSHVTPETARRLEAAGFPQPKIQFGQIWYENVGLGIPKLIIGESSRGVRVADSGGGASTVALGAMTFSPTATDILKQFKAPVFSHWFEYTGKQFQIRVFFKGGMEHQFFNENPAEAAAMAWLQVHEKK